MKKGILFAIVSLMGFTNVFAACSEIEIKSMSRDLANVSFNYTVMPSGSSVFSYGKSYDVSNKIRVTPSGLSDDYYVYFQSSEDTFERMNNYNSLYLDGGVYKVSFQNTKCGVETIKSYYMMVPYFNDQGKDIWFDGTYETKKPSTLPSPKRGVNVVLVVSVVLLVMVLTWLIVVMAKRRRSPQL